MRPSGANSTVVDVPGKSRGLPSARAKPPSMGPVASGWSAPDQRTVNVPVWVPIQPYLEPPCESVKHEFWTIIDLMLVTERLPAVSRATAQKPMARLLLNDIRLTSTLY